MRLFSAPPSPYSRKVKVALHETEQFDDVEIIYSTGTAINPGTLPVATNPLGKIPTLERPDGPALYDSRVICRYLDARAGSNLYPSGDRLWEILTLEATGDGIVDSAIAMVYEGRVRPTEFQYQPWVEAQWAKVSRAVATLNDRWISQLHGSLTMGHISVACALGYLDFRLADRGWRDGNGALADWYSEFANRDSMQATLPKD